MRIQRILVLMLVLAFITVPFSASAMDYWQVPVDIKVNGSYIYFDQRPFLEYDTTYVPIRFVSEALGADEVSWETKSDTAVIKYNGMEIRLPAGKDYGYVNGEYIKINKGVRLVGARTFVPVRFIAENMGANVDWDYNYFVVMIDKAGTSVNPGLIKNIGYTEDDIYWLSRIIEAEASGEPMEGKIAVGNVILNRVYHPDFPNDIYGVIFDTKFGVQFQPVSNGTIYNTPSTSSVIAAKHALEGVNLTGNSLYFLNEAIATNTWISNNRPYLTQIGNHAFYA